MTNSSPERRGKRVLKMKTSDVRDLFFRPLKDHWCELSIRRLRAKLKEVGLRPVGLQCHQSLLMITHYMLNIYEDEDDAEEYLSEENRKRHRLRKERKDKDPLAPQLVAYEPVYHIRPTTDQVREKILEYWNIDRLNEDAEIPEKIPAFSEFVLLPHAMRQPKPEPRLS